MMEYEDRIREKYPSMSKSFVKLADFILDSYIEASFMTATELAHAVNVDTTTVVRFSQQLGYSGYPHLLREIRNKVRSQFLVQEEEVDVSTLEGVSVAAIKNLRLILDQLGLLTDLSALEAIAKGMGDANRIYILPDALAQPAAYTLLDMLERGGFVVTVVPNNVTDLARTLKFATPEDLIVAIELEGTSPYIRRTIQGAIKRSIPTAALLSAPSLETARICPLVLAAQVQPSTALEMINMNALVYVLGQAVEWMYAYRFEGVNDAIRTLSEDIQEES